MQSRTQSMMPSLEDWILRMLPNRLQRKGRRQQKWLPGRPGTGPIVSSGWDFFEALYFGGTTEWFLRGGGTLFGTYTGGFLGEQRLGRFGYLVGSHLGSWIGGRTGLMVNGVQYLLAQSAQSEGSYDYGYAEPQEVYASQEREL